MMATNQNRAAQRQIRWKERSKTMDPNDWTLTGNAGTNPATNFLGTIDNEPLVIRTNGTEHLRITPDGNVGIGTTSPNQMLQLHKPGDTTNLISFGDSEWWVGNTNTADFMIYRASNAQLYITSAGNVGIGTTTPTDLLEISGSSLSNLGNLQLADTSGQGTSRNWRIANGWTLAGDFQILSGTSVGEDPTTPRLTIDINGNVGIGTVNPAHTLEVNGSLGVSGDILLTGADCAEEFDIAGIAEIESGTVVVLDENGALLQSRQAHDKRVAGVISGARDYKAGLILGRQQSHDNRALVALVGKVYCKVDAQYAPIEVGDLLTTSPTPGHAMKAEDPLKAFGSVIGKALRSLETGQGLVPILIALQ
jgi:hypothetical protein